MIRSKVYVSMNFFFDQLTDLLVAAISNLTSNVKTRKQRNRGVYEPWA